MWHKICACGAEGVTNTQCVRKQLANMQSVHKVGPSSIDFDVISCYVEKLSMGMAFYRPKGY